MGRALLGGYLLCKDGRTLCVFLTQEHIFVVQK